MATKDDFTKVSVDWGECKRRYKTIIFYKCFFDDLIRERCELVNHSSLRVTQQILLGNLPCGYDPWWLEPSWEWGCKGERWYRIITNGRMWSRRNEGEGALGYSSVVVCMTDCVVGGGAPRRRKCRKKRSFTGAVEGDSRYSSGLGVWVLSLWGRAPRAVDTQWCTFFPKL